MTSDAKIGLLLGLVFIFVIAFIINGLPGLHQKGDGNKLTTNMVGLENNPSGLGANERRVQQVLEPAPSASPVIVYNQPAGTAAGSTDARFTMALPQNTPAETQPAAPAVTEPVTAAPSQPASPDSLLTLNPAAAQAVPAVKSNMPVKQAAPKFYVVQDGDTLSDIAKKIYGEQEGNRLVNIKAIFEANRKTLASENELYVGQKLLIPPLTGSAATVGSPSVQPFVKVDSIGKRRLPATPDKSSSTTATRADRVYVVKEGDSLWRIAADCLGDGNRYKEIVRLNSDILSSEDDIQIDMKLKLPAK